MEPTYLIPCVISGVISLICGFFASNFLTKSKFNALEASEKKRYEDLIEAKEVKFKGEAKLEAQDDAKKFKDDIQKELQDKRESLKGLEKQIQKREDVIEKRAEWVESQEKNIKSNEEKNETVKVKLDERSKEIQNIVDREKAELYKISNLSLADAKDLLLTKIKDEVETESSQIIRDNLEKIEEDSEKNAQKIIGLAITRLASQVTAETTTSTLDLPSDDLKGKIIGREGRNIRAFEKATGVDLIVDDTPGVIILSSFDILRREVAKRSMQTLLKDGRIHPARIEEVVRGIEETLEKELIEIGTKTCQEMRIGKMHPKLRYYLGKMKYRTSYGQSMLSHSKEVADICASLAGELKVDITVAKRAGLLHDIGKAADQEMEGTHPQIGSELTKKYDEHPYIVNAVASHHEDVEMISIYSFLTMAADAISSARPGARRETSESYIKRLENLEAIANDFDGVEQTFAIQAGREIRVLTDSSKISDEKATILARDIANRIENEMQYPGHVKVTVLRELRVEVFAK
ncbi:MAG: ribonuclease Y [Planctomycetota bacterium]|nr:MAG: ribonuclease Y [Planctomycetota bacterium]